MTLSMGTASSASARASQPELAYSIGSLPGASDQATGVTCTPEGPCVAIDYSGQFFVLSGPHAELVGSFGTATFAISCPTRTFCAAVGDDGALIISATGSRGYPLEYGRGSNTHWQSISCTSSTFCMAGGGLIGGAQDGAGVVARWNGAVWSPVKVVLPDLPEQFKTQISSMSCGGPTLCVGADGDDRVVQWNGKAWFQPSALTGDFDSFSASCTLKGFCLAAGGSGGETFTWTGHSWRSQGSSQLSSPYGNGFVSCLAPNNCLAVTSNGFAQQWDSEGWGSFAQLYANQHDGIQGLACSTAGFCEAVTSGDHFIYIHNPRQSPRLPVLCGQLSCQKATV